MSSKKLKPLQYKPQNKVQTQQSKLEKIRAYSYLITVKQRSSKMSKRKVLSAYIKIQMAMNENEVRITELVRNAWKKRKKGWNFILGSSATYNTVDRLVKKKKIRYSQKYYGYVPYRVAE